MSQFKVSAKSTTVDVKTRIYLQSLGFVTQRRHHTTVQNDRFPFCV